MAATSSIISSVVISTAITAAPAASSLPLSVIVEPNIGGTLDFFPFDDLANVGNPNDDVFSFRDLIKSSIAGDQSIVLFGTGCLVDGVEDCTRACNNTENFFGSLETFYDCIALASISHWTHDTESYYITPQTERNASVIMGSGSLANFDYKPTLDSFITCAQASCGSDQLSVPCGPSIKALSIEHSTADEIFEAMNTFCPDIPANIDPDIFGPGVLISYVLQVCFSGSLYLAVQAFTLWARHTEKKREPYTLTRAQSLIWRDTSTMSRTSVAMATTLVEFQEAQCWFVFALQIASILAIVINSQDGTFWGEIIVNGAVAFHVSLNGVLPMFLVQVCLHNEGIRNWHTFLGFCAEYLLAIIASTQKISFSSTFDLFKQQHSIEECGGNPSPRTYCAATHGVSGLSLTFFPHPLFYKVVFLALDSVTFIALVIDQLSWTLRKHRRTKHLRFGRWTPGRWPENRLQRHWKKFAKYFWRVLEILYFFINILYMVSLVTVISAKSFEANKWSYGQIIAITCWGPVIVKLIDLIVSGPPKNGEKLNSGPPRLRIDNIINHRLISEYTDEEPFEPDLKTARVAYSRQETLFSRTETEASHT
ncbi:hypothetical protein TRIATDRAFT_86991 [Trichoderma atroviride IMI 206040]|uniref:Uncharacterized protein n=1 Tax=Hypocrea atroviridis (strain ATCC 20476 / IMI 206040) TaxID=452589 RepID=G9NZK0_HYPAI|nr:uncharacterized protein TRIATDRAFT_86991 [Trichoderma atroviride IMI 206040]EHK43904.1 hypothetical protein TRIATDRAFT_86991 [Trichoderma atroviride IMI 206040]